MTAAQGSVSVGHDPRRARFEAWVGGSRHVCDDRLDARAQPPLRTRYHTLVPPAVGGRSLAAQLVAAALAQVRRMGWQVLPQCSDVATCMQRHPDTADLLRP